VNKGFLHSFNSH